MPTNILIPEGQRLKVPSLDYVTQFRHAQMVLRHLGCGKTTEQGHDEIYYVLAGQHGDGTKFSFQGPDAIQGGDADGGSAWDMNDSGDARDRDINAVLYEGQLAPGQAAKIVLILFERDGTDLGQVVHLASEAAKSMSTDPYVTVAAKIADLVAKYIPSNTDDFIGSFSLQIFNDNGQLRIRELMAGSYASVYEAADSAYPGQFVMRLNHDDGDYWTRFEVRRVD